MKWKTELFKEVFRPKKAQANRREQKEQQVKEAGEKEEEVEKP